MSCRFFGKSHLPSPWGTRPDHHALRALVNQTGTPQLLKTPVPVEKEEDLSASHGKQQGKNGERICGVIELLYAQYPHV